MVYVLLSMSGYRIVCWNIAGKIIRGKPQYMEANSGQVVLADEIVEALRKVISILDKARKMGGN